MFSSVDWVGVVLAALAAFAVGGVWFAPPVFGNRWGALVKAYAKLSDDDMKPSAPPMIFWLVGAFINAITFDVLMGAAQAYTIKDGLVIGGLIGLGIGLPLASWPVIFARQPRALWFINVGAFTAMQLVMGLVLGARAAA